VRGRGADGGDDALADARDDRLLARAADEPGYVRAHRDPRLRAELDAVLRDRGDDRRLDDLRVDRHLDGLEDVPAGEVDRAALLELQRNLRGLRGNQRVDDAVDAAAGEQVRLEFVHVDFEPGLRRLDHRHDDLGRVHAAEPHDDQRADAHAHARRARRDPEPQRHEPEKQRKHDQKRDDDDERYDDGCCHNQLSLSRCRVWRQVVLPILPRSLRRRSDFPRRARRSRACRRR